MNLPRLPDESRGEGCFRRRKKVGKDSDYFQNDESGRDNSIGTDSNLNKNENNLTNTDFDDSEESVSNSGSEKLEWSRVSDELCGVLHISG